MRFINFRRPSWGVGLILSFCVVCVALVTQTGKSSIDREPAAINSHGVSKEFISSQLGAAIRANTFPTESNFDFDGDETKVKVTYALDQLFQQKMQKTMNLWRPDHAAFVAIDATTGRIITMVSYQREKVGENLTLQATFPAASIFKVVTASAAIDSRKASSDTVVPFNGGSHTLYKRNVNDQSRNRWTRFMTMKDAFARSVNTFFGKLGLFYVGPEKLLDYAEKFRFNRPIRADVPVDVGIVKIAPEDPWSVVTAASGFTRDNTMSPLHGALIASAVVNDGVMMEPYLIESLADEDGNTIYQAEARQEAKIMAPASAAELRELMRETVRSGTSRKSFRTVMRKRSFDDVEMGGKTGSLTGTNPKGKCDWFVGYARFGKHRIAVAALTVNEKKWRVKSSTLASEFLSDYVRHIQDAE